MTCIECGATTEREWCSKFCEDLWTYGPSTLPGWTILEVDIGSIRRDGKGGARKKWDYPEGATVIDMIYVKGPRKNLVSVGWKDFILQCEFKGSRRYRYGGVPEDVKDQILGSESPDLVFNQIVRRKFVCERVGMPKEQPAPTPLFDCSELPF